MSSTDRPTRPEVKRYETYDIIDKGELPHEPTMVVLATDYDALETENRELLMEMWTRMGGLHLKIQKLEAKLLSQLTPDEIAEQQIEDYYANGGTPMEEEMGG